MQNESFTMISIQIMPLVRNALRTTVKSNLSYHSQQKQITNEFNNNVEQSESKIGSPLFFSRFVLHTHTTQTRVYIEKISHQILRMVSICRQILFVKRIMTNCSSLSCSNACSCVILKRLYFETVFVCACVAEIDLKMM